MEERRFENIDCPVCCSRDKEVLYERVQYTGRTLGEMKTTLVMCQECGFVYRDPRPSERMLQEYYGSDPQASGRIYQGAQENTSRHQYYGRIIQFLKSIMSLSPPGRVLDIGSGQGHFLEALTGETSCDMVALDPFCEPCNMSQLGKIQFIKGELQEEVTKKIGLFDVVTLIGVLEHVSDPKYFLDRIASVLKEKGVLLIEVPDSLRPRVSLAEWYSYEHLSHFTQETLARVLAACGFEFHSRDLHEPDFWRLRVAALRKENPQSPHYEVLQHREKMRHLFQQYEDDRKAFEEEFDGRLKSLLERWRREKRRVALYGAGGHTVFLSRQFELGGEIVCIVDSDPSKQGQRFLKWVVLGPQDILRNSIDAILISSDSFQEDIWASLEEVRRQGVEVACCYPRSAGGERGNPPWPAEARVDRRVEK